MFQEHQINELVELLATLNNNTKIYFGCDSVRKVQDNKWFARYATCVIVHKNGNNGCRIFSHETVEPDYDVRMNRPSMRLMNETMKVCEAYTQLVPWIDGFDIEIHLDINTNPITFIPAIPLVMVIILYGRGVNAPKKIISIPFSL